MTSAEPSQLPSSNPVLARALKYGAWLALGIAVVMGVIGLLVAGVPGVLSALIGTAMALVFLGITAASILVANRFITSDLYVGAFFGIVLGAWLVKFVLFIVLLIVLKNQPFITPLILFISIVAGVVGSLLVDVIVVARSRLPYASDVSMPAAASSTDSDAADAAPNEHPGAEDQR